MRSFSIIRIERWIRRLLKSKQTNKTQAFACVCTVNIQCIVIFERYMYYSLVPLICATAADDNLACASCISGDKLRSLEAAAAAAANARAFWLFNRFLTS